MGGIRWGLSDLQFLPKDIEPVGAGLARDDGMSVDESIGCQALIAGKPGSHRVLRYRKDPL
ncbi:hypothetical protein EMIT0P218_10482 [Pseudomonas sp. IT-P218]